MEERRMEDKTRMIHKVYLNARKSAVFIRSSGCVVF